MRIGVLCSGGDSPGMNACVRSVVRTGITGGHEVVGILRGYKGLLQGEFFTNKDGGDTMTLRSVSNLTKQGGTILHSSRCPEFQTDEGVRRGADMLVKHKIEGLITIGGNGTYRGASALSKLWDGRIIGCPGTIDNDLLGTDYTIGFATAVHTAVDAIDKLRDTADSHERLFLVEVMGRHSGYIALYTALAGAAEIATLPETTTDVAQIVKQLQVLKARGKQSIMIVVSEGDECGGALRLHEDLGDAGCPFTTRVVNLGHVQRGGSPAPADRILATRLGHFAVQSILAGETGKGAGIIKGEQVLTPFVDCYSSHKAVPKDLLDLLDTMAH